MNTSNQLLSVLLGLQIAALVGMGYGSTRQNRLALSESVELFPKLSVSDVDTLEIFGPPGENQETVKLKRSGEEWVIPNADNFPAQKADIENLITSVIGLKSRNQVLTGSTYHTKLEVAESDYRRKLVMGTSNGDQVVYLGSSPSFKNIHIRRSDDDTVYQVTGLSESDAGSRAWNWVNRNYVSYPEEEVWSITLKNEHGSFQLDKDPASNTWALVGEDTELDTDKINELVNDAREIGLEAPIGKEAKAEYKLGETATLTLTVGTSTIANTPPKATKDVTLQVGKKFEDKDRRYFKSSESEYVVEVAGWELKKLLETKRDDLLKPEEEPASQPAGPTSQPVMPSSKPPEEPASQPVVMPSSKPTPKVVKPKHGATTDPVDYKVGNVEFPPQSGEKAPPETPEPPDR